MNKATTIINNNNKNSLKLGKKYLVGFLDFLLFFLLTSVIFASYESIINASKDYKEKVDNVSILEEELADISVSSNLTKYIIDEYGNETEIE